MLLYTLLVLFVALAVALVWFLVAHDHGEKEPIAALWMAAGLGLAGAAAASPLESLLIPKQNLTVGTAPMSLLLAVLTVGVIEETCKFLPLALIIYRKRYFNEHTDGIIYFALAGLGFGLPENILYTMQFGSQAGTLRIVMTGLFHSAITGMIGYFLVKCKLSGKSPFAILPIVISAIILHGIYDFGLLSGSVVYVTCSVAITLGLSIGLFVLFLRANEQDQDEGRSIVGHNTFCRSCGFANPRHHLYCVRCGKNA